MEILSKCELQQRQYSSSGKRKMPSSKGKPTDPKLREEVKEEVKQESKGVYQIWGQHFQGDADAMQEVVLVHGPPGKQQNLPNDTRPKVVNMRIRRAPRTSQRKEPHRRSQIARRTTRSQEVVRRKTKRRSDGLCTSSSASTCILRRKAWAREVGDGSLGL